MIKFIISESFLRNTDEDIAKMEIKIRKKITDRKIIRRMGREIND
jgi:hypothetical protein